MLVARHFAHPSRPLELEIAIAIPAGVALECSAMSNSKRECSKLASFLAALVCAACSGDEGGSEATGATTSTAGAAGTDSSSGGSDSSSGAGGSGAGDSAGLANGGDGGSSSGEPRVRFVGRVDETDASNVRFAWSGTGIVARFSGTSVAARLTGGQQYTVLIDGVLQPKLVPTGASSVLADNLTDGPHDVEIYRRTEANQGESVFSGFDLGAGTLLAPPAASERRIEIIGDSISCGYGNEGPDMNCGFTPDTENHYLTYGALAARALGAELTTVAWSGKGVVCNYGDDATSCMDPMPLYYDRTLPNRAESLWSFSVWQPQAVVINLGTNDFSTTMDPARADFETGYADLLGRVREAYPDAVILCTVGPLLTGTDLTTATSFIESAVQARVAQGDTKVKTFVLAPTNPNDGYGCDWHPSLRTHEIMAEALTEALREELGW
jgi:lysophospholipase L1-like esterase